MRRHPAVACMAALAAAMLAETITMLLTCKNHPRTGSAWKATRPCTSVVSAAAASPPLHLQQGCAQSCSESGRADRRVNVIGCAHAGYIMYMADEEGGEGPEGYMGEEDEEDSDEDMTPEVRLVCCAVLFCAEPHCYSCVCFAHSSRHPCRDVHLAATSAARRSLNHDWWLPCDPQQVAALRQMFKQQGGGHPVGSDSDEDDDDEEDDDDDDVRTCHAASDPPCHERHIPCLVHFA